MAIWRDISSSLDSVREQLKSQLTLPVDSSVLSSYSHKLAEGLEAMLDKRHKDAADILTDATSLVKSDIDQSHYLVVHYIMTAYALMQAGEHDKAAEKLRLAETVVEDSGIIYMLPKSRSRGARSYDLGPRGVRVALRPLFPVARRCIQIGRAHV